LLPADAILKYPVLQFVDFCFKLTYDIGSLIFI
jgi:hypothetical protein